jgi:hypothetical protein
MLPLPRALPPRARRNRRPFLAGTCSQPYRLPHEVRDRLVADLAPYRNREAAYRLAVFLGRFWSMPGRVALPFPIDRRALADRQDLGLSEARVRGAIRTLEEVGFLARAVTSGSRYRATAQGLHRKPVPFQFGSDYAPLFIAANQRAGAARGGLSRPDGPQTPARCSRPSVAFLEARPNSPKGKSQAESLLLMGENLTPLPKLSALALRTVFGKAEAKRGGRG